MAETNKQTNISNERDSEAHGVGRLKNLCVEEKDPLIVVV